MRKVYDNLAITGPSVAVALVIGGIERLSILTDKLSIDDGLLAGIASVDLEGWWAPWDSNPQPAD